MSILQDIEVKVKEIKSYVKRCDKLTGAQKKDFSRLWLKYGLNSLEPFHDIISNKILLVDIGFGYGDSLIHYANLYPEYLCIGIEVFRKGCYNLMKSLESLNICNVRVFCEDAIPVLNMLPENQVAQFNVFFADPWPKYKHHKRRIFSNKLLSIFYTKLKTNGLVHFATDCENYAKMAKNAVIFSSLSLKIDNDLGYSNRLSRPVTKYEQKALANHGLVYDLVGVK